MRKADRTLLAGTLLLGGILILVPLSALIFGAFQTESPGTPGAHFTLRNFAQALGPDFLKALGVTLLLGLSTAVFSVAGGGLLAWIIARTDMPGRALLETLIVVPTFLPPLVGATGWLLLGAPRSGMINTVIGRDLLHLQGPLVNIATFTGVVWVMGLFFAPVAYLYIVAALRQADATQEEAARIAGARTWQVLLGITLLMLFAYRRVTAIEGRFVTVTGKASRPRTIRLGRLRWAAVAYAWLYVLLAVVLPYIALGIGSFQSFFGAKITRQSLTLRNWRYLLGRPGALSAFRNSLLLGLGAATLVVLLGGIAAYALARRRPGKGWAWFDYLLSLSVAVPGIAFGVGMVWAYVRTPLYGTPFVLLVAYVTRYLPNGLRAANTGLLQVSKDLEESAAVGGASALQTLRDITAPLLRPALFSAWTLTVIIVLRELSASSVLYTPTARVLSVLAWDYLESSAFGYACVIGLIQTAMVVVILIVARAIFKVRLAGGDAVD